MTVGEKIRYIRYLRKMTQKQLGIDSGFSSATADVRIRQYESNKMIPKADRLNKIAEALDVNIYALSDINITSLEDIMHILFELEETFGLTIEKKEDNYYLSFDKDFKDTYESTSLPVRSFYSYDHAHLFYALDTWYEEKKKYSEIAPDKKVLLNKDYQIWKKRYPLDLES